LTTPYPGTELYQVSKKLGNINQNTKWENFAPLTNSHPILVQNNLSAEELIKWQKYAFRKFYLRPKYIFGKIKNLIIYRDFNLIFEGFRVFRRILKK